MKFRFTLGACALGLLFTVPSQSSAQAWFFPDYALPSSNGTPATWLAATYGRGLNDSSGKTNAFGGAIGRTTNRASFIGVIGQGRAEGEGELTLGGGVGVDVYQGTTATLSVQGGIGWLSADVGTESLTSLRFPIGVALKGMWQTPEAQIVPWVMPRLNFVRVSLDGSSENSTDFGASTGVTFNFPNGFGVHTALDLLAADSNIWYYGIGVHYVLGGGGN